MALVKFFRGTKENYNSNLAKNAAEVKNGIYFITDEHCIMMNGVQYGGVDNAMFNGFIKDVDVEGNILSFKKDVEGTWTDVSIKLLEAADNSIVVGDILKGDNVKDGSTIKVNVKAVGEADGLKLGADGLYVDLTKTTQSITDETARATQAEGANKAAIEQEKNDRIAAINSLNAEIKGGDGKFIQSVKEENGVIAAVEADLTAAAVAYDKTADKVIAKATDVSAAIKELDAKVAANKDAELTYKTVKLTAEEVTALGDVNVKEAYKVVSVNKEGTKTTVGDIIKIYKDSALVSIDYTEVNDKSKKGQFLKYVYTLADGTEKTVYVDMSKLVDQAEVEKGIQAIDGKLSIKLAEGNEADFLTVDANGLKLSGVQTAINNAQKAVQDNLDAEITRAKAAEKANADAIKVLNGAETVTGSVAKAVADAKKELLGDAAAEYNTLGKLEDKIQALDDKATKAHTEVVAKAEGHVRVAVANSTDGTHKVVTISENDIASAAALTDEINRAKAAEEANKAAIDANAAAIAKLNGDEATTGSVAKAVADAKAELLGDAAAEYNTLGKLEDKIQALDVKAAKAHTEVVAKADGHVRVAVADSTDGTHKVVTVSENDIASANALTAEITRAKGAEEANKAAISAEASRAQAAEAKALTDAKAYTDTALSWIEGGSY